MVSGSANLCPGKKESSDQRAVASHWKLRMGTDSGACVVLQLTITQHTAYDLRHVLKLTRYEFRASVGFKGEI